MILYENNRSNKSKYIYTSENININIQEHLHNSFEVIFVFEGDLVCTINGEEVPVKAGSSLMILPEQVHSFRTPEYCKSELCIFSVDMVEEFYNTIKNKEPENPVFNFPDAHKAMKELKDDGNLFCKKSVLYKICSAVYEQTSFINSDKINLSLIGLLASYVQENYTKEISLRQIAKEYGYNYNYLSTFFNANFKQNFSAYVNQFRLQYAAHLLETTDKDITEIVHLSGFSTIRNFNTAFKKQYGITPREYRK